jgi:outer membrane protein assembly factor BamB
VIEKDLQIRLVCLDAARGRLLWSQALAVPPERLLADVARRVQAIHLAYADGVLVCPTHVGAVVGVDLLRRSVAWAYPYREEVPPDESELPLGRWFRGRPRNLPRLRAEWRATAPVVHAGRVFFTAPDTASLHCLDLRTGTLHWKAERADGDLYLAGVHGDRVVLVGRQNCRALRPADGQPLWTAETGVPSGLGVADGAVYYLPCKAAGPDKEPAVLALDLERGTVRERAAAPEGEVPGNLVFAGDTLLAQTVTAVTAYPRAAEAKDREK